MENSSCKVSSSRTSVSVHRAEQELQPEGHGQSRLEQGGVREAEHFPVSCGGHLILDVCPPASQPNRPDPWKGPEQTREQGSGCLSRNSGVPGPRNVVEKEGGQAVWGLSPGWKEGQAGDLTKGPGTGPKLWGWGPPCPFYPHVRSRSPN